MPFLCIKHTVITDECSIPQDIMNMQKHSWNSACSSSFALKFMSVYSCLSSTLQGTLQTKYRNGSVGEELWITCHLKSTVPHPSSSQECALSDQQ